MARGPPRRTKAQFLKLLDTTAPIATPAQPLGGEMFGYAIGNSVNFHMADRLRRMRKASRRLSRQRFDRWRTRNLVHHERAIVHGDGWRESHGLDHGAGRESE
jgi:hypothetical protein